MLIPVGGAEVLVGGLDRLTCKDKGRTMGFPGGPPPTPKLDEVYFEREREFRTCIKKKTHYLDLVIYRLLSSGLGRNIPVFREQ